MTNLRRLFSVDPTVSDRDVFILARDAHRLCDNPNAVYPGLGETLELIRMLCAMMNHVAVRSDYPADYEARALVLLQEREAARKARGSFSRLVE